jgi:hypothetical protein
MIDQAAYDKSVDEWVVEKAAHQIEWSALLDALPGVYPSIIRDAAIKLGVWRNIRLLDPSTAVTSARSKAGDLWQQRKLATPHAVDGCWWFADDTLKLLSDWARRLGSAGDVIALFGAPTLFHYMQGEITDRDLLLVDRIVEGNISHAQAIQVDLMQRQPTLSRPASVAVVDPPWYAPETRAFLLSARLNSTVGAKILLSVPPIGTRPGVQEEWNEMVAWSRGIGLRLLERRPLVLRYLSPPFETNALRAAGVPMCPADWRRGDLAVFECDHPCPNCVKSVCRSVVNSGVTSKLVESF